MFYSFYRGQGAFLPSRLSSLDPSFDQFMESGSVTMFYRARSQSFILISLTKTNANNTYGGKISFRKDNFKDSWILVLLHTSQEGLYTNAPSPCAQN